MEVGQVDRRASSWGVGKLSECLLGNSGARRFLSSFQGPRDKSPPPPPPPGWEMTDKKLGTVYLLEIKIWPFPTQLFF